MINKKQIKKEVDGVFILALLLLFFNGFYFISSVAVDLLHFPTYYFPSTGEMDFSLDLSKLTLIHFFIFSFGALNLFCTFYLGNLNQK